MVMMAMIDELDIGLDGELASMLVNELTGKLGSIVVAARFTGELLDVLVNGLKDTATAELIDDPLGELYVDCVTPMVSYTIKPKVAKLE